MFDVTYEGQDVEELITELRKQIVRADIAMDVMRKDCNAVVTIRCNIVNENLTDAEFRQFVSNIL